MGLVVPSELMHFTTNRERTSEQLRTADLLRLVGNGNATALDVGARDGHLSLLLTESCDTVTALDLNLPAISHPRITCVKGDVTKLAFGDDSFDLVVCAEVLEHIHPHLLGIACSELTRVTRSRLLIGVPYQQDLRVGRTTCGTCGVGNPPWGHLNAFDEPGLRELFRSLSVEEVSLVGQNNERTNFIASFLMDLAGNPYGTYAQQEVCVACGASPTAPPPRSLIQKGLTKTAFWARYPTQLTSPAHANWIHILFAKGSHEVPLA